MTFEDFVRRGQAAQHAVDTILDRSRLARIACPICQRQEARASKTQPGKVYCPACNHIFERPPVQERR